jgi:phage shock protein A
VGTARRAAALHEVDLDALLERAEDPRVLFCYSVVQYQDLLCRIWSAITDVAARRARAQMRETRLRRSADRLQGQAGQATAAGRDSYARQALAWRAIILRHAGELAAEQAALRATEDRLCAIAQRLQERTEAVQIHRESVKDEYTSARAVTTAGPLLDGGPGDAGDMGPAKRRAEDRTARVQARALTLDGLVRLGAREDASPGTGQTPTEAGATSRQAVIDEALARVRDHAGRHLT